MDHCTLISGLFQKSSTKHSQPEFAVWLSTGKPCRKLEKCRATSRPTAKQIYIHISACQLHAIGAAHKNEDRREKEPGSKCHGTLLRNQRSTSINCIKRGLRRVCKSHAPIVSLQHDCCRLWRELAASTRTAKSSSLCNLPCLVTRRLVVPSVRDSFVAQRACCHQTDQLEARVHDFSLCSGHRASVIALPLPA